ncbi:ElyC/SanA/YdcF family protein [Pontibacter sp. G13]|uniref:SanA/YdcF family protein n=1 Tax=Pontibacter sp. G13 TaxID=3074898 RepID=UPI0028893F70|nr:ElyC/SanA/YdcF family protein [Pontibacter sp. G13]WNJ16214.1 ElyC/SanA/YdcF family protein [Pontibacter sp. G13]
MAEPPTSFGTAGSLWTNRSILSPKFIMRYLRNIVLLGFLAICLSLCLLVGVDQWTSFQSQAFLYSTVEEIPARPVGLVLGANPHTISGRDNPYFTKRINAAANLYKSGKVKHLIVSGDNHSHSYNEPEAMMEALTTSGVPRSAITLDYAGFRTFDSIVRCKEVFSQNRITIISQPFHNERALLIALHEDMDAIAFNAQSVSGSVGRKTLLREYLARLNACWDLYIWPTRPTFLGEKVDIGI